MVARASRTTNVQQAGPAGPEKPTAQEAVDQVLAEGHTPGERPNTTVVEGQVPGEPNLTVPGDGPADTTDPREMISTITPSAEQQAAAAKAGPNAATLAGFVKTGEAPQPGAPDPNRDVKKDRFEEYEIGGVKLRRNLETGTSERVGKSGSEGQE